MERKLYELFDQTKPSPEQEEAILARLLRPERRTRPMRNIKASFVALAAVIALLVTSVSAAAIIGLNPDLLNFWGIGPEEEHLLSPAAVAVNKSHTFWNGWTLEIRQALADRYSVALLVDVTAPEGTVLDGDSYKLDAGFALFDADGRNISNGVGFGIGTQQLEDGDPLDDHLTLLYTLRMLNDREQQSFLGGSLRLSWEKLSQYDPTLTTVTEWEDRWRCTIPLSETDTGLLYQISQPITMGGCEVTLESVYLSPLTLTCDFSGGVDGLEDSDWLSSIHANETYEENVLLNTRSGETIQMAEFMGGSARYKLEVGRLVFRLPSILDPAEIVSITLYGQTYHLP